MIERKSTFILGIFIFVIPFLGFPSSWKTFFICLSGLSLIALSVKMNMIKKPIKARIKREKAPQSFDMYPMQPKPSKEVKIIAEKNLDSEVQ